MNIFRLSGDMCRLVGVLLLLRMAMRGKSSGISLKAQELYLVVYLCRYLDVITTFYSIYNSLMKIFYIASTALLVKILRCSNSGQSTYSPTHDSFQHWKYILVPAGLIAPLTTLLFPIVPMADFDLQILMEILWTFSIYLESVAMVPQLIMFRGDRSVKGNLGEARDEILLPVFLFGIYRALYVVNWVYRSQTEMNYRHHWIVYGCGVLQVLLYAQFFLVFYKTSGLCEVGSEGLDESTCALLEDGQGIAVQENSQEKDAEPATNVISDEDELTSHILTEERKSSEEEAVQSVADSKVRAISSDEAV